jgi:predicted chitinase
LQSPLPQPGGINSVATKKFHRKDFTEADHCKAASAHGEGLAQRVHCPVCARLDQPVRPQIGIDQPHRLAHFLVQELHESGGFRYDKELANGAAYEGRKDLGNTQKGDGVKFKGRGPEQITGRANYSRFTKWVRGFPPDAPDFTVKPDLVNTDPFEGLTAIWFWSVGTGKSLNVYADRNDIEMITRKVNGDLNGYDDRLDYCARPSFCSAIRSVPTSSFRPMRRSAGAMTATLMALLARKLEPRFSARWSSLPRRPRNLPN